MTWTRINDAVSWCSETGKLRYGTWKGEEYKDDDGNPVKFTSTGYYDGGRWVDGPPPYHWLRNVYGEPYSYLEPTND